MPRYRVTHQTRFRHTAPVSAAWQVLHLRPRDEPDQRCCEFELTIAPTPADLVCRPDFFGNVRHVFTLRQPHRELVVTSQSVVQRAEPNWPMAGLTPPLAQCGDWLDEAIARGEFELAQYRQASARVPWLAGARALAAGLDEDGPSLLTWVERLGARFRETFTFEPGATQVSTPLERVLAQRRGVCQDFAHLFLSCLRDRGLAAAYVSGYILTAPPPGSPRLVGADASHAWISVFVPGTGWVDYDPTNHALVGAGHIAVARGRDYGDVSPIKGIFSGGGRHQLFTAVTVAPEAAEG
jgi:transglutaminase-like putative cysteine protease